MLKFISKHSKKAVLAVELAAVNLLLLASNNVMAQAATTPTPTTAPARATTINGIAANATNAINSVSTIATALCVVVGLVMIGNSLNNLYKASKDPSHQVKPMAGIIGLVIGGLLTAVGSVVTIMSNSVGTTG